jgi:undecaprenyl pyrophosphate phosphatase UppP
VPQLLGWQVAELDPAARKTLEVALHLGSAGALTLLAWRHRAWTGVGAGTSNAPAPRMAGSRGSAEPAPEAPNAELSFAPGATVTVGQLAREACLLGLTFAPPAVTGLALERPIEQRLGGVRTVAWAQVGAGLLMWVADRRPEQREQPNGGDHLAVGLGQAFALIPGVSRSGAALTAARARGLSRRAAVRLSFRSALPVTLGAALLKGVRSVRGELAPELRLPLAAGALAALATGVASAGLAGRLERTSSLGPIAAYRVALGAAALARSHNRA